VLPAVERVIELNVVDPDRLALMGQSYGAYGVYCLLTQTRIFRAAIAIGGMSDLVSLYGAFDARERYTTRAHEPLLQARFAEGGQLRMGAAPWQDAARYVRNSPIFTVDRIHTPLLIVQGDLDFVGIQQGEEMFTALYRLGRRARFVRYWGEGHGVESPANIRDLWRRMTDWLEDCWN
jgi:dipeptidyl aminopeptidase/acylaminoacyl peptidase